MIVYNLLADPLFIACAGVHLLELPTLVALVVSAQLDAFRQYDKASVFSCVALTSLQVTDAFKRISCTEKKIQWVSN